MKYTATNKEIEACKAMLKKEFGILDADICESYAKKIIQISYSIGGDYSFETLFKIGQALLSNRQ